MAALPLPAGGLHPALAQFAIKGGRHAAREIMRHIDGTPSRPFRYWDKGMTASVGRDAGIVQTGHIRFSGRLAFFAWGILHILYVPGWRNRLSIDLNWLWSYVTHRRAALMLAGITDRSVLGAHGWAAANALMAAIELAGLLLVLALTRPWARRVPAWLLLFSVWVGTGLLFRVVVGAALAGLFSPPSHASSGSLGGFQPWVFVMVYASFAGQGAALAIAFACYLRARWGPLLGERTGEVIARRTARARSWPANHLAGMAEAAAGMTIAVAAVFCYWAAGGSFGLSGAQPHPSWALQASRVAGAVIAVAGLLGLAGRWGHQTRFWLPAALAWVGSGSLAAFDGLELFLTFGTGLSGSGWSLADTVLVIEVAIGVLCAAVGALAVTSAGDNRERSRPAASACP